MSDLGKQLISLGITFGIIGGAGILMEGPVRSMIENRVYFHRVIKKALAGYRREIKDKSGEVGNPYI